MADDFTERSAESGIERTNRASPEGFLHLPVMVDEIVEVLSEVPSGVFVDATLGGGGHSDAVLRANEELRLVGIDRDPDALVAASERLGAHGSRITFRRARFDQIAAILEELEVQEISGFLFDLGVSSPQLDRADRGFSYRQDGPIDMRMDTDQPNSADDLVNEASETHLTRVIADFGDERFARRIAQAIVAARPLSSTVALADIIVGAIPAPARRRGGHPAKRTFQALRIAVNGELEVLPPALESALDALCVGGRGLVLTYHSGEDRLVKAAFRRRTLVETPPGLPVPAEEPEFTLLRPVARRPSAREQETNRRSASARLRGIERTTARAA